MFRVCSSPGRGDVRPDLRALLLVLALPAVSLRAESAPPEAVSAAPTNAPLTQATVRDELEIARQALRDGLYEVARAHAALAAGEAGRLVVAESYARESKWGELLRETGAWRETSGESMRYYRALALAETGQPGEAAGLLETEFRERVCRVLAQRLRARLKLNAGDAAEAVRLMEAIPAEDLTDEAKMELADMKVSAGDVKGASTLWREVVAGTNASERSFAVAAVNLGDVAALRMAYQRVESAPFRRYVGFRLGWTLIAAKETFAEGERLIRQLVKDAPDADGARESYAKLSEAYLAASRWQEAADLCRDALEMWPDSVKSFALHENRGWALAKLGRREEALEAFARAEKCAADSEGLATVAVKQGDILNDEGRADEAMAKYRMVLEKFPDTRSAKLVQRVIGLRERESEGRRLYRDFMFAEAQKVFAEVAKADPLRAPRMNFFTALCLYGQGMDDAAERQATAVAEQTEDPRIRSEAVLWLAKLGYNRGKWELSRKMFVAYADRRPDSPAAPESLVWAARAAFAENEFAQSITNASRLVAGYPDSPLRAQGYFVQGEALIELARFDEAVLVLELALQLDGLTSAERERAQVLRADALFAMGADDARRFQTALDSYRAVRQALSPSSPMRIVVSFKIAKTLEKLRQLQEALDVYYADVLLAYRDGRIAGERFDEDSRVAFSRAAFRLADEFEGRGYDDQALKILQLVATSDVPASEEAARRMQRIKTKGGFL